MTSHLLRHQAPIAADAWELLDGEARQRLAVALGARKLVDFHGPLGWQHSATNLGRVGPAIAAPVDGVIARVRRILPLTELRAGFDIRLEELVDASRGAADVDLTPLDDATHRLASVENAAVFHGWDAAGMNGILAESPHPPIEHDRGTTGYDDVVASAVATLKRAGVGGPYALALSPADWTAVMEATDTGYPLLRHLGDILGGPIEWVPGLRTAAVLSLRGGDYLLDVGEDVSLGYSGSTAESVGLYLEETFAFRVATPEAAIEIRRRSS